MSWKANAKLLQSDLLVGLRHWYSSTTARDADLTAPTAGTIAVIGARTTTPSVTDTLWEYLYDGAAWVVLTSPWQAITALAGWTGTDTPAVRFMGGLTSFKGHLTSTGSVSPGTTYQAAQAPAGTYATTTDGRAMKAGTDEGSGALIPFIGIDGAGKILIRVSAAGTAIVALGALSGYSVLA